jgi:hypothetical protein
MNAYNWDISPAPGGQFTLAAHGIPIGTFPSKEKIAEYIQSVLKRDLIERRAQAWAAQEVAKLLAAWILEFELPAHEILEDIKVGLDEAVLDLLGQAE